MNHNTKKNNILFYFDELRSQAMYIIAKQLQLIGYNVRFCTTSLSWLESSDVNQGGPAVFIHNNQSIKEVTDIDIFVTDDIKARYCQNGALCVCLPHSLIEKPTEYLPKFEYWQNFYLVADFVLQANRLNLNEVNPDKFSQLFSQSYPKEFTKYRNSNLYIIPAGYPKLDLLKEAMLNRKANNNALLFAPTTKALTNFSIQKTKEICILLLENYPDREIIYRPYPSESERLDASSILNELKQYSNFTYDNQGSILCAQLRSELMITDLSSAALSFSFSTFTPHIQIVEQSHMKTKNSLWEGDAWYELSDLGELVRAVNLSIKKSAYWKNKIEKEQYNFLYQPENSINHISKQIDMIAQGKVGGDWLNWSREMPKVKIESEDDFFSHIEKFPHIWNAWLIRGLVINYLRKKFPFTNELLIKKINSSLGGVDL